LSGLFSGKMSYSISDIFISKKAELVFVGDIMLSRNIGKTMKEKDDWTYYFKNVRDVLASADLAFANLESVISSQGTLMGSIYSFRADPRAVEGLSYAGFDVVSLANNHVWDYGGIALSDTFDVLKSVDIGYVGAGNSYAEAHTAVVKDVKGMKIAFLGYTNLIPHGVTGVDSRPAVAFIEMDTISRDILKAKESADIVVVSYHWGDEYQTTHNAFQERIAHATIDAGALMVIGHHPHVVQEVESYKDGLIAYSLGNFVFDQNFSTDTREGMLLKVTLMDKKISDFAKHKVVFADDFQTVMAE